MPARNSIKKYLENSYYHIYNRGVEKRLIFQDLEDYSVFLSYLKNYLIFKDVSKLQQNLSNKEITYKEKDKIVKQIRLNNFSDEITLIAYALMPNHFHFLVKQKNSGSIDTFMNSLGTRYTMYFNRKYKRVGHLYQGVYKAVNISSDEQLLHLSRYIHCQALDRKLEYFENQPSSYLNFLNKQKTDWVHPEEILKHFSKHCKGLSYESFILNKKEYPIIDNLKLESD